MVKQTRSEEIKEDIDSYMLEINAIKLDRNAFIMLMIMGMLLNMFVVGANGWQMPAICDDTKYYCEQEADSGRSILGAKNVQFTYTDKSEVKFWWLSDIIRIDMKNNSIIFSSGDVIMLISMIVVFVCGIKEWIRSIKIWKLKKEWKRLNHSK
jgi:hypothetical protein